MDTIRARSGAYERPSRDAGRSMRAAAALLIGMVFLSLGVALGPSAPIVPSGAGRMAIEAPVNAGHLLNREVVRVAVASKKDDAGGHGDQDPPAFQPAFADLPLPTFRRVGVHAPRAPPAVPSRPIHAHRPRAPPSVFA